MISRGSAARPSGVAIFAMSGLVNTGPGDTHTHLIPCFAPNCAKDFVRPIEKNYNMRKKFVKANVKAGIIGIALMVILIILSSSFIHVLLSIYAGIATYTLIFLNGYPTLTRKLLTPNREIISTDEDERTSLIIGIIKLIIFVILIPWFLIVWLISPINYIFSIKTRVVRMKNYDNRDAIYIEEKYPL